MIDLDRLQAAYEIARDDLLAERISEGHWIGELSASALSTATAVSALALVEQNTTHEERREYQVRPLIANGLQWLIDAQNDDGGWGDTDKSYSNIATTMLVVAAFHVAGKSANHSEMLARAEQRIESLGSIEGLRRRYGKDKTFAVPILTNCALAGRVPWSEVAALPFEAACVPQRIYRFLKLPVVSYAIPALVAIGQAKYFHKKPLNPFARIVRAMSVKRSLKILERMQPKSGGYLEAIPLTSFVVMSLAGTGRASHPVTARGVDFLLSTVRRDGSWPIDTNLATWNTTLAINALAEGGEDVAQLGCLDWLLECQHTEAHPFTGAKPGGWGWSDLSGAVPDADDTAGALLALALWRDSRQVDQERLREAGRAGIEWLLALQNGDGGWPTFCRGWGKLPFDRSGTDLTAHVLRAFRTWCGARVRDRLTAAEEDGFHFLAKSQRPDGSWIPLWFGNQDHPEEENPVYGTAKVLMAYRGRDDLLDCDTRALDKGLRWLCTNQHTDGGWGSAEETALATEALLSFPKNRPAQLAACKGLEWLVDGVENGRHVENAPIGFYFAKLWYHERLYPMVFTVAALGRAVRSLPTRLNRTPAAVRSTDV
ncbi:MAG: squalene--hopene cyclase [Planctomycetes bacterium]|nr:squalene--hopene cyclase [Planctomycetota bacterium]